MKNAIEKDKQYVNVVCPLGIKDFYPSEVVAKIKASAEEIKSWWDRWDQLGEHAELVGDTMGANLTRVVVNARRELPLRRVELLAEAVALLEEKRTIGREAAPALADEVARLVEEAEQVRVRVRVETPSRVGLNSEIRRTHLVERHPDVYAATHRVNAMDGYREQLERGGSITREITRLQSRLKDATRRIEAGNFDDEEAEPKAQIIRLSGTIRQDGARDPGGIAREVVKEV